MKQTSSRISDRRQFLKLAGLGSAAGAATVASSGAEAAPEDQDAPDQAGYRETDHVRTFYRMARF